MAETTGRRKRVTLNWQRDMRLLIERGPLGFDPAPEPADRIARVIEATFGYETWWATRITDPKFLRKHYVRIVQAADEAARNAPAPVADTAALIGKLRGLGA